MNYCFSIVAALSLLLFVGCNTTEADSSGIESTVVLQDSTDHFPTKLVVEHAKGFKLEYFNNYKLITVLDPWNNNEPLHQYRLFEAGSVLEADSLGQFIDIQIPVEEAVCLSTTHLGFMEALGLEDKVIAVDETDFVYNEGLRKRIDNGDLIELGDLDKMRLEKVVDMQPDLIMVSPMEGSAARSEKLQEAGIPFAFNIEWQEGTLIARAEWIKFVAAFFNAEAVAKEHFDAVSTRYDSLVKLASKAEVKPNVLPGAAFKGTWYLPGGDSFIAHLLEDAGGHYHWKDEAGTGSFSLSMEQVVDQLLEADVWVNPNNAKSLEEIELADDRYTLFDAYQEQKVYNNNARLNEFDNNDYWESGTAWPDRVLADLIKIFHPELLPDHSLYYYHQLQ